MLVPGLDEADAMRRGPYFADRMDTGARRCSRVLIGYLKTQQLPAFSAPAAAVIPFAHTTPFACMAAIVSAS